MNRLTPLAAAIAAGALLVPGSAVRADDLNPGLAFSIRDSGNNGSPDSLELGLFNGLLRNVSSNQDRALQEYDVTAFAGFALTEARIKGTIFNNNAGGSFPRDFDIVVYEADNSADLTDYNLPGTVVGSVQQVRVDGSVIPVSFDIDILAEAQAILDNGAVSIGLRVVPVSSNLFPAILSDDVDDAILTIDGEPGGDDCPGDLADTSGFGAPDGMIDFGDFFALSFLAGSCGAGTTNPDCDGDLADTSGFGAPDGMIDFGDFFALSFLAGPCP